jgi:hypothetical protein
MPSTIAEQEVLDQVHRQEDFLYDELGASYVPRSVINSWKLIDASILKSQEAKKRAHRLNSHASLFYFAVRVLQKTKFQLNPNFRKNLHFQMCQVVMKDGLKEVIEIPRDHFKSSVYSECFPVWRALPFSTEDEDFMYRLGCSQLYIEWMRRAHKQDIRTLLVSETILNASKLGKKIRNHYDNNEFYKQLFPEILPGPSNTWTDNSLHQKRTPKGTAHGEGTYDFIGVGAALQSRHYDLIVQDDLVGRDALKSETVMANVIEYHQLLVGAMDADVTNAGRDIDEIVVGNRWSYKDLNSHIRAEEPYYNFITHSALGGCCALHPQGEPIFPEAFNVAKLARYKARLGSYLFSCQYLNFPINPEKCKFNKKNLRYFHYERTTSALTYNENRYDKDKKQSYRVAIRHHVNEGDVEEDIFPRNLTRYMIIDPNHSGQKGRCRHAITITGVSQNPRRIYVLAVWAKAVDTNQFIEAIFHLAKAFAINTIHIETVAAQKYLKFHLEYYVQTQRALQPEIAHIKFADLKSSTTANAKTERIDSVIPITERGELWVNANDCAELMEEIEAYGNKKGLIDILDTLGYGPQVWKFDDVDEEKLQNYFNLQQGRFRKAMRAS